MLPTICEITDVDSNESRSRSSSPADDDNANNATTPMTPSSYLHALDSLQMPPTSPQQQNHQQGHLLHKRRHSPPVSVLLLSERRLKLRKAAASVDYEMKKLNHQISLAQQYTDDIVAMRIEQTRMEARLRQERKDIADRHVQLIEELRKLANDAVEISRADAEVTVLKDEYAAELQYLEEMKIKIRRDVELQRQAIEGLSSTDLSRLKLLHEC